jgi:hypothetical protein
MDAATTSTYFFTEFIWPLIVGTAVIWLPFLIVWLGWGWWLEYVRKLKLTEAKFTMIEIRIPKEVFKSPAAIETILTSMYGDTKPPLFTKGIDTKWSTLITDFGKWYDAVWLGKWPLWWSLEIASIEGNIYFFMRCEPKNRETLENLIYAQFPQAEVTEVDDYTKYVPPFKIGNGWDLRGGEYKLKETFAPDPNDKDTKIPIDALPMKTYVDYGLHEAFQLEEEQKIDPLVPLLQVLGSLGQGEQIWIQYVIEGSWAHFDNPDPAKKKEKPYVTWQDVGRFFVSQLLAKYASVNLKNVPEHEKPRIEATERKLTKYGYDCGIRVMYLGKGDKFKKDKFTEIKNAFKQFNAPNLNSLECINQTDDGFDYPWQDYKDLKKGTNREKMFKRYVKRDFFYPPEAGATLAVKKMADKPLVNATIGKQVTSVLSTEELATLFHFPGTVAQTSALGRIDAQKAEPPANLPI